MKRPLPDISDQKLVVLLKRDDLKSYEVLFHRYYDLFLTFTKRVVREHVAAEDIVQEVFMQLWLGRDRLDEHRSLYNRSSMPSQTKPKAPKAVSKPSNSGRRSHGRSPPCRRSDGRSSP